MSSGGLLGPKRGPKRSPKSQFLVDFWRSIPEVNSGVKKGPYPESKRGRFPGAIWEPLPDEKEAQERSLGRPLEAIEKYLLSAPSTPQRGFDTRRTPRLAPPWSNSGAVRMPLPYPK